MSQNCQHLYEENIKLLLINTIFWLSSIFLLWKWNFLLIFEQFCSNENYVFSIKPHPPLIPGKVFDIFKVCSAGQFIAAFPISVILKKMTKTNRTLPKVFRGLMNKEKIRSFVKLFLYLWKCRRTEMKFIEEKVLLNQCRFLWRSIVN